MTLDGADETWESGSDVTEEAEKIESVIHLKERRAKVNEEAGKGGSVTYGKRRGRKWRYRVKRRYRRAEMTLQSQKEL